LAPLSGTVPIRVANNDLAEIPLLVGVQPALLDLLADRTKAFSTGEALLNRGDPPKHILIIRSGEVTVQVRGVRLVTRKRNDILGEQAFINEKPHSADCIAATPVQAICVPSDVARALLLDPAFVRNLFKEVSEKLREATDERYVRFGTEQLLFAEFRSHVSREVLEELLNRGEDYGAPRQVEDVAVLFSDIRGFTSYVHEAGREEATRVAQELSSYLSAITETIHAKRGFVDKFIGDAVMAFWGYPGIERPHNDDILTCARDMIAVAVRHVFERKPARIGIGLNQGTCFMGNIGSAEKRQFTIVGDAVNVASRFESLTKDVGANIIIGKAFFDGLGPEQQQQFTPHNQDVRGAGTQTFYSLNVEG
jgi:class 3 adenylate cyclase